LGDALDDCQAEADACVVGAYAVAAALKRLGKRGDPSVVQHLISPLSTWMQVFAYALVVQRWVC
jgi:hypothetical protein